MYTRFTILLLSIFKLTIFATELHPLSDAFIDLINREGKWKAGRNFHPDTPMSYVQQLLGVKTRYSQSEHIPTVKYDAEFTKKLPKTFDPREKWPNCSSLHEIRDQGSCGSSWAVAAAAIMTDRTCIYTRGPKNFHYSAEDIVTCAVEDGCQGASVEKSWEYWYFTGVVSGGNYNSNQGCQPYTIPSCEHHTSGTRPNCTEIVLTPSCKSSCIEGYNKTYAEDKQKTRNYYRISGENDIMTELFTYGPVECIFSVYDDFFHYKSGVYQHIKGEKRGLHAAKIMGWGIENGTKYWLVANSWNTNWGDKGFFKILRGVNECDVEYSAVTGKPLSRKAGNSNDYEGSRLVPTY